MFAREVIQLDRHVGGFGGLGHDGGGSFPRIERIGIVVRILKGQILFLGVEGAHAQIPGEVLDVYLDVPHAGRRHILDSTLDGVNDDRGVCAFQALAE